MREWRPVSLLFVAGICGGVAGYYSAPLFVDGFFADLLQPITTACGVPIGLLAGMAIARHVFREQ